jgi:TetR/AcrR family transcriptional regulator, cholesterol catabolism regulator
MTDDRRRKSDRAAADEQREQVPTSERLLVGSAELFREKGYAGTTTRALSALVGIQNASLYHHVGGKEDLLYRLCVAALDDVAAVFAATTVEEPDPVTRLELLARRYVEQALQDRDRHATMLTEIRSLSAARRAEVIGRRDENVAVVEGTVRLAQEAGQLRTDIDAKYLTLALFNLLNWTIFWFDPAGELGEAEIAEILWSVFSAGTTIGERSSAKSAGSSHRERSN